MVGAGGGAQSRAALGTGAPCVRPRVVAGAARGHGAGGSPRRRAPPRSRVGRRVVRRDSQMRLAFAAHPRPPMWMATARATAAPRAGVGAPHQRAAAVVGAAAERRRSRGGAAAVGRPRGGGAATVALSLPWGGRVTQRGYSPGGGVCAAPHRRPPPPRVGPPRCPTARGRRALSRRRRCSSARLWSRWPCCVPLAPAGGLASRTTLPRGQADTPTHPPYGCVLRHARPPPPGDHAGAVAQHPAAAAAPRRKRHTTHNRRHPTGRPGAAGGSARNSTCRSSRIWRWAR